MRIRFSLLSAAMILTLGVSYPAAAQTTDATDTAPKAESSAENPLDLSVSLESRYLDTRTFNDVFSDSPSLQIEATYSITPQVYVSAYGYTGFKKPFADASSEYGFEAGYERDVGNGTTVSFAAGRYADYEGQGFHSGDWYAKVGIQHGPLTASVSALSGDSNTVLVNVSYDLPIGKRLTVSPSIAAFTSDGRINPGLAVDYRISDHVSLGGRFVLPDNGTGTRKFYAAAALTYHF